MATIYGSHLHEAHVYGSGIHASGYMSRKHLKRAIKYGSYYGGFAAPAVHSVEATAAPIVHAPLYGSRYHTKGGYQSSSNFYSSSYLSNPVSTSPHVAPVSTYSQVYGGYQSRQAAYFAQKASKYGSFYGSFALPTAIAVSSEDSAASFAAPAAYGSRHGLYGSAYLSRKHLKRAIKYGTFHGGLAAPMVVSSEASLIESAPIATAPFHNKGVAHQAQQGGSQLKIEHQFDAPCWGDADYADYCLINMCMHCDETNPDCFNDATKIEQRHALLRRPHLLDPRSPHYARLRTMRECFSG